ncbi:VOC family protein [Paenibacillus sp. JX-17]|uniref:VOC family protein n=1 Tax=Paenibacillus lacisoli TaxID=3064525 RepID=A0ABT9CFM2_9BACL|nr:VOC family protein [Paenibacillus sp. JX-17]MDO7907675.1 VOC family protein [Paenibacillus sp. JX-17]
MIERIDHLVFTVRDLNKTIHFYTNVLGMELVTFGEDRKALVFGHQKINLHEYGNEFEPKANKPLPGSEDLCFITSISIAEIVEHLDTQGIEIEEGPVQRTGAMAPITSVYIRDPDGNLIELSSYS